MGQVMAIMAGGALGAVSRYGVSIGIHAWLGRAFPYGTLAVNVLGSVLAGLLVTLFLERLATSPEWRGAVLIGFLGSFTTFSTFAVETVSLAENGNAAGALMNGLLNPILCIAGVWLGVVAGRILWS